jgi:anti-sigma B factor antagonist
MEISAREEGQVKVVSVTGSVDGLTSGDVQSFLDKLVSDGDDKLVLDLGQLDFLSSAGLRAMLAVSRGARQSGGDLRLVEGSGSVQNVLEMAGFPSVVKTFPDVAQAVASFAGE